MGTTRIKVIDLSSDQQQVKTSRKHAEKLAGVGKIKEEKKDKKAITESTEINQESTEESPTTPSVPKEPSRSIEQGSLTTTVPSVIKTKSKAAKPPTHHRSKKYQTAKKLVESKTYSVKEAFELLPKTAITTFDPSVEVHLNVVDRKIKASVNFPHMKFVKKQEKKYLVFSDKRIEDIKQHIIWANESTITDIETGKLKPGRDFDTVIASPKFMPTLARIAKILGPRGMMPNPKNGTVVDNIQKALILPEDTAYELRTDPQAPIFHVKIGKLSQKPDELSENLKTLIVAIGSSKIKKATLTSTMGPPIRFDVNTL